MRYGYYTNGYGTSDKPCLLKTCSVCSDDKPLDAYSRNNNSKDGLRAYCKDCDNINRKERGYAKQ